MNALPATFTDWFARRGWSIHPHQQTMLDRAQDPALLLIAPTGGGKTLAGFLPTLVELADGQHTGLHTLYVSPLKALAAENADLHKQLDELATSKRSLATVCAEQLNLLRDGVVLYNRREAESTGLFG